MKLPRKNTLSRNIIKFIGGSANGRRAYEIERFINQSRGREWNPTKRIGAWKLSLYGYSGRPGLLKKYCIRKPTGFWHLTNEAAAILTREEGRLYYGMDARTTSILDLDVSKVQELSTNNAEIIPSNPSRVTAAYAAEDLLSSFNLLKPRDQLTASLKKVESEVVKTAEEAKTSTEVVALIHQMNDARTRSEILKQQIRSLQDDLQTSLVKVRDLESKVRGALGL